MTRRDLSAYFHRHCRLRLRSGKEVFGVLWQHEERDDLLYFASHSEHHALRQRNAAQNNPSLLQNALLVTPEEILAVESL